MSSDKIGFEDVIKDKVTPELTDSNVEELRKKSIAKLEQKQSDERVKLEAGITEPIKEAESIPKELPILCFKIAGKAFKCEKMPLDNDEAKVFAKHLSNLIGSQNSKVFDVLILFVIILGKVWGCWDAIINLFKRKDKKETEKTEADIAKAPEVMQ